MRLIISLILAALMVSCATPPARSQSNFLVVSVCGTLPLAYAPGAVRTATIDVNGKTCTNTTGSAGDASAANQVLQITQETAINTILGLQADAACATDNGTCTIAALVKRGNQRLTTIIAGIPVTNAGTFAVQATLTAETTKVIGTVNQGTSPWVISGAVTNAGTFATQSAVTAASGSYASGSLASGAMVDLVALSAPVAPATATATKSTLLGAQATTGAVNPTNGQQGALSSDTNNNLLVSAGGAPNLSISQVSVATSDTAVVSARALRRSVTIQQITGTQNVFCNQTTATAANGVVLPAVVGASVTLNTTSAVRCIAITGAQTVAVAETF